MLNDIKSEAFILKDLKFQIQQKQYKETQNYDQKQKI